MINARTSALYLTVPCRILYFNGKGGDSCNKLHQVCQLFLSMIVASMNVCLLRLCLLSCGRVRVCQPKGTGRFREDGCCLQ